MLLEPLGGIIAAEHKRSVEYLRAFFLVCRIGAEKQQATIIALILLGANAAIYFVFFIVFWLKKAKKS